VLGDFIESQSEAVAQRWISDVATARQPGAAADPAGAARMRAFIAHLVTALRAAPVTPDHQARTASEVQENGLLIGVVLDLVERAGVPVSISELRQLTTIVMAAMVVAPAPTAVADQHKLSTIFRESPAAMAFFQGPDHVIEMVNPSYAAIFEGRMLLGRRLLDAIPELADQAFPALLSQVFTSGESFTGHEVLAQLIRRPGGPLEDRYYDFTYVRINDADGAPYGVYDHAVDVTDRVLARRKLEEGEARLTLALNELERSEAQLRQLADTMPQIVWAAQPDGVLDYYNRRWFEYIDLASDAVARWDRYIHPDDLPATDAAWTASIETGTPYQREFRVRRADQQYRWFLVRALPVRAADGAITRWFGTCTDIQEQKELEARKEALLEAERAARIAFEQTGRLKDEFLATLSHELRTPLNAILGWVQVMMMRPMQGDELKAGLERIERNARVQARLVDDLLDMSRVISGTLRLDVQAIHPASFIEAAIETVMPAAAAKGISIETTLDADGGPVSGDPQRLQQVVWNLLSNAIKFTPGGGTVTVALTRNEPHVELSIVDTGQGIRPDFLPHVFSRFRQDDAASNRRIGGLGLGLAIVKQLVELHGGTVHVDSAGENTGTTVVVRLPLQTAMAQPAAASEPPPARAARGLPLEWRTASFAGLTVVVVDDERDGREFVRRVLEDCQMTVHTAGSAAEALDAIRFHKPDVLVSDIGMAGVDGYELLRRVRELGTADGGNVTAIALTAFARAEDAERALLAGFRTHLSKPVEPFELVATIAEVTGRTATERPLP